MTRTMVAPNPYYAVTDEEGNSELTEFLPAIMKSWPGMRGGGWLERARSMT